MERPVNSKVRHGMASCARYGCKRPECMEAQRRDRRESSHGLREGGARVSGERAGRYVNALVNAGMSALDISERSGVSVTQVRMLRRGKLEQIFRVIEDAILGVPMPEGDRFPDSDGLADATGSRRRLQALSVQGFPASFMSAETGMTIRTISAIRMGERLQVRVSGLRIITATHDRLWDEDPLKMGVWSGDVTRAKQWAQRQGWMPTEAWADIDDPDCVPALQTPRYVALTEDAQELIEEQGYTRATAAERLGVKKNTLDSAIAYYSKAMADAS